MTRLEEILARMAEIREAIETLAAVEGDLDEAQRTDWDAYNTEWDTLEGERVALVARNERLAMIRSAALDPTCKRSCGNAAAPPNNNASPRTAPIASAPARNEPCSLPAKWWRWRSDSSPFSLRLGG